MNPSPAALPPQHSAPSFFTRQASHVRQCLREGWMAVGIWCFGLVSCCTALIVMGYVPESERPEQPLLVWGMPAWVFWGLFVPWIVQIAATWWFALCWLKDDEPYEEFPTAAATDNPAGVP